MKIRLALSLALAFAFPNLALPLQAQVVPGTGQQIMEVFDDFEDPTWSFTLNLPKSSSNIDKTERHPSGFSANRLYLESLYRGTPDFVRRVETPAGGIPGSTGALAMQTLNSGIPGQTSGTFQQDDLIAGVQQKLGYMMPVSWTPSYVVRVYVPPFHTWERRHGSHFGFRADCVTTITKSTSMGRLFKNMGTTKKLEQYWPGFFIQLNTKQMTQQKEDYAQIVIRGDANGHEVPGPKITQAGWWTLGMTFTPDGKVHYYAREGVQNLTARDHLYSGYPYGYNCEQTSTFFFNIVNQDDGRTWSTRWIVDDPKVYVASGSYRPPVQQQVAQKPAATTAQVPATQTPGAQPPAAQAPAAKPAAPTPATIAGGIPEKPPAVVATPVSTKTTTPTIEIPKVAAKPSDVPPSKPTEPTPAEPKPADPEPAPVTSNPETPTESIEPSPAAGTNTNTESPKPVPPTPVIEEPAPAPQLPPLSESPAGETPAKPE